MTEREAIEGILETFESGWETLHPASVSDPDCVPWTTKNEDFDETQLGVLGAWARIAIIHTSAEQITQGLAPVRKFERRGNVFVQLFAPVAAGVGLLADLAQDVRTVLEGQRVGALNLAAGRTQEGAEDARWAMVSVVIPFRYVDQR